MIDNATFNKIQKLKKFVNFIANLEIETSKIRANAKEVNYLISNINNKSSHKDWSVFLDIFDRKVQNGELEGIYWRKWSVSFESEILEIVAESYHSKNPLGYYSGHYNYFGVISFNKTKLVKYCFKDDINAFLDDAFNYKQYIVKTLNDIEFEIDV